MYLPETDLNKISLIIPIKKLKGRSIHKTELCRINNYLIKLG
jgi:hypothetical protein